MPRYGLHLALPLWAAICLLFSLGPLATVTVFSFNESRFYAFPINGWTLEWYSDLFTDDRIAAALATSVGIGICVTVLSTLVGTGFAFGVVRARFRGGRTLTVVGFLPLVTPVLVLAVALQVGFLQVGLPLGYGTVLLGHTIYTAPFVALMVISQLIRYDHRLDAAARDLGAGPIETLRYVTLPILWPSIRAGALLAFLLSFNEWAIAFFTGRGFNTLPMLVYSMQRNGLPPAVLAYSSLTILLAVVAVCLLLPFLSRIAAMRTRRCHG
jgi:ABC-type spermidine/putrescine transport system permease subunit II